MKEILLVTMSDNLGKILTRYASGRLSMKLSIVGSLGKAFSILKQRSMAKQEIARLVLDLFLPEQDPLAFAEEVHKIFSNLEMIGLTTNQIYLQCPPFAKIYIAPFDKNVYMEILTI